MGFKRYRKAIFVRIIALMHNIIPPTIVKIQRAKFLQIHLENTCVPSHASTFSTPLNILNNLNILNPLNIFNKKNA